MTSMSKKVNYLNTLFYKCNFGNCESQYNYHNSYCMSVVTIDHTSRAHYLQIIRGLNPSVIANRVYVQQVP